MVTYSFIVTIYNDGYLADAFCRAFEATFQEFLGKQSICEDVELIFVNDGSLDESLSDLRGLAVAHRFVKVIDLSRNFGQHPAILCGYHHANGRYVGRLNVDMQDPPAEIPKLLRILEREDVDIVIGIQKQRKNRFADIVSARLFFWTFNLLTGSAIPQNTATLRVMNRRVADAFRHVNDKFPFMQGLETWFGFRVKYTVTEHRERQDGRSSYTFFKRLKLGVDAAISFSDRPLRFTVYGGLLMALCGFGAVSVLVFKRLTQSNIVPGYSSTMAMLFLGFGVQIMVVGLCGLYIGKILTQVQDRPTYLVRETINFQDVEHDDIHHARINEDLVPSTDSLEARKELYRLLKSHPGTEDELERSLGLFIRGSLLARLLAVAEVYKQILPLPGIVIDLGTWRGQTAVLCENCRAIFEPLHLNRRIVCFDTFEGYKGFSEKDKPTALHRDGTYTAGGSEYAERLLHLLEVHERNNAMGHLYGKHKVIQGDCRETLPRFFAEHRHEFVALAFFDVNSYEPTSEAFNAVWERLVPGGLVAMWQLTRDVIPAEGMVYVDSILGKRAHSLERSPIYPGLCVLKKLKSTEA